MEKENQRGYVTVYLKKRYEKKLEKANLTIKNARANVTYFNHMTVALHWQNPESVKMKYDGGSVLLCGCRLIKLE